MLSPQSININFAEGLDTKTDPWQVSVGKFLSLENSVFDKGKRLTKRNGYKQLLGAVTTPSNLYLTTLNDNLTAVGSSINSYNADTMNWVVRGSYTPLQLSTLPLIRNAINQIQCDSVIAPNGLVCTVYSELQNAIFDYKYVIADSVTGQNIVIPTLIPAVGGGVITGTPRVFMLGTYFIIVFTNVIAGVSHLQYICISSTNPNVSTTPADIASSYIPASTVSWDGVVTNRNLYIAYNTTTGGQAIKITYLSMAAAIAGAGPVTPVTFTGANDRASMMSLCVDATNINFTQIYVSFYSLATTNGYTLAIDGNLNTVFGPQQIITTMTILNLASAAQNGVCTVFSEVSNTYSYDSSIYSNFSRGCGLTLCCCAECGTGV